MSSLSFAAYCGCMLCFNFLAVCFVGWVLRFVYRTASEVTSFGRDAKPDFGEAQVLCPCVFRRFSTLQFTLWCTVASVAFSFLNVVIAVVIYAVYLTTCSNCEAEAERPLSIVALAGVHTFCLFTGYLLMFVTHFERLRLTFSGSMMELPQWAPKVLYLILLAVVLLMTIFIAFRNTVPIVSAVTLFLFVLLYFVSTVALIRAFYKKTVAMLSGAEHRDGDVTEAIIRVTVSVIMSLLTTTVVGLLYGVLLVFCSHCILLRLLGVCILTFDVCFNALCLMCAFARAEGHYKQVFGRVHGLFLSHAPPTLRVADSNSVSVRVKVSSAIRV